MKVILAIGRPVRLAAGFISPEEKGELLMKEEVDLDEGVSGKSLFDFNDYFEEFGIDFDSLEDFEGKDILGLDVDRLKKQAVYLPFRLPKKGDLLLFKRFLISDEEFGAKFIFPYDNLEPSKLIPLVFDFGDFCGAESLLVGFFYIKGDDNLEGLREFLNVELKKLPRGKEPLFLKELDAALTEGRLPFGPKIPGEISFHPAVPLEAEFEEHYEVLVIENRAGETECYSLEIKTERPIIEI
ncbi:hypothetical protein Thein_1786 [Thermodesulfatator indicus DSM 15286]|uniref:Uncharacterized protein n=1 Tax=Thermodesulfatator indicus (strain DSM 15286 / JCM 11887 / CIR29812) TaxID=667014 RepID=F8ABP0_THEID|nr:hypothetical protein [Thermodesulfatator indicus]AEH45642.1 hypothetical protein Thein_1786 [Thermodesulfatator indicus DSM 15286]